MPLLVVQSNPFREERMNKKGLVVAIAATLTLSLMVPIFASAGTAITAHATGDQVVNPSGGDPKGVADFRLNVNRVKRRICYTITFSKIQNVTGAFLHKGGPNQIARPIATFFTDKSATSPREGCVKNLKKRIVKRLKRKPDAHYVDLTSKKHPDGAVRGQLEE